ncbi:MAG: polymer-forming cytoskeletal protein [Zoogloeaceae bacterium]|nr:polymer-forming cytoskeletal protein [Zoogloeaceae bacterium]
MFAKKNGSSGVPSTGQISLIAQGTKIEGNIFFTGDLQIDGEVCGQVRSLSSGSRVGVSEHGIINGEVDAARLSVNGEINGPVKATEFLEMQPKARITGDVSYAIIEIQQGAVIEGRLLLMRGNEGKKTPQDKPRMAESTTIKPTVPSTEPKTIQ